MLGIRRVYGHVCVPNSIPAAAGAAVAFFAPAEGLSSQSASHIDRAASRTLPDAAVYEVDQPSKASAHASLSSNSSSDMVL